MLSDVHVVIPVAGIGTRLRPHTYSAPKVLLYVAGKPILAHILDELKALGVRRVTLVIGYLGDQIREFVSAHYDFETTYALQEDAQGLGHAIWCARDSARDARRLLIILGDTIFKADLKAMLGGEASAIAVKEVDDPHRFGIVEVEDGHIKGMEEKPEHPKTNLAVVGIYYITNPRQLFDALDDNIRNERRGAKGEYQLTDGLQAMIEQGTPMIPFPIQGWYDCGKAETLIQTNRDMLEHYSNGETDGMGGGKSINSVIRPPVFIHPTAVVENSVVGPHVTVAKDSVVRDAIVRDSIISPGATVEHIVLDGSIISPNARVAGMPWRLNVGDSSEMNLR